MAGLVWGTVVPLRGSPEPCPALACHLDITSTFLTCPPCPLANLVDQVGLP
jgi:hypothetical protein